MRHELHLLDRGSKGGWLDDLTGEVRENTPRLARSARLAIRANWVASARVTLMGKFSWKHALTASLSIKRKGTDFPVNTYYPATKRENREKTERATVVRSLTR